MHDGVGQESGVWELKRGLEILGAGRLINNEPRITKSEFEQHQTASPCAMLHTGRALNGCVI